MGISDRSELWKFIAAILATIIVTIIGTVGVFGSDGVTEAEVQRAIRTESPYIEDRKLIHQMIADVGFLQTDVSIIREQLARIEGRIELAQSP